MRSLTSFGMTRLLSVEWRNICTDSRNDSMHVLLSLIIKDFYIKTPADARIFESCPDNFYPISNLYKQYKERLKIGNKWYFIRDKFFDSKSGYVVTLDQNSKIINIAN